MFHILRRVYQIDFTAAIAAIATLNTTIENFPDDSGVVQQIQKLVAVPDTIPCLNATAEQIELFNATLFRLPSVRFVVLHSAGFAMTYCACGYGPAIKAQCWCLCYCF